MPTAQVIIFPRLHRIETCNCGDDMCHVCAGGLAHCLVCHGAEASLTENCCGRVLTEKEHDRVAAGDLDFRAAHGGWTTWTRDRQNQTKRQLEGW